MTNLANKFSSFEEQVATQHTEVMTALNTIAYALGAPPTTPTTTLEDLYTQLSAIIDGIALIYTANNTFHAALLSSLDQMNTNTDILINNNSLNTQRLLIAIAANDPCKPCDIVPIEPPPIDITPQLVDQDHCKRMQALIYALRRLTVKLDVLSSFGLGFSPTVIRDAITELLTELGVIELLEYPSLGEVAQLAGAGAAYVVSNVFGGGNLPAAFLSIEDSLLTVLYDTDNASAGQNAYRSFLTGSSLSTPIVNLFQAMAYTSIFNLYYDSTVTLDLSGYDGTICAPVVFECFEIASTSWGGNVNGSWYGVDWGEYATDANWTVSGGLIFKELTDMALNGWVITILTQGGEIYQSYSRASTGTGWTPTHTINLTSFGPLSIYSQQPFTLEICPPV